MQRPNATEITVIPFPGSHLSRFPPSADRQLTPRHVRELLESKAEPKPDPQCAY